MSKYTFIFRIDQPKKLFLNGILKEKLPSIPDYTTIRRRINLLDIKIKGVDNKEGFWRRYNVIGVIKSDGMITEVIDKLFCDGVYDSNAILMYP